jgi:hypothetical protein
VSDCERFGQTDNFLLYPHVFGENFKFFLAVGQYIAYISELFEYFLMVNNTFLCRILSSTSPVCYVVPKRYLFLVKK